MSKRSELLTFLSSEDVQLQFARLYGTRGGAVQRQVERYSRITKRHAEAFGAQQVRYFSAPGRSEIGGNHTDHQHGRVLAASVNLDTIAAVSKNDTGIVTLYSEGYSNSFRADLASLAFREDEKESTAGLIRGVAAGLVQRGYSVGGFDAVVTSNVLKGSGLSSSAAFEVLLCSIFSGLYNEHNPVDAKINAMICQYAENVHFGKPCGLMDQMASSVGGVITIDFATPGPDVREISLDLAKEDFCLVVVDTGGSHANLTGEYAAIPAEMKTVARALNGELLIDIPPETFFKELPNLRKKKISDRALLRAIHFYDDNARVLREVHALEKGDFKAFLHEVIASGESSWKLLQNIHVGSSTSQGVALALEISSRILSGKGAWRVHGGGFAGTIQAFVPMSLLSQYENELGAIYGKRAVSILDIRPVGAVEIK